MWEAFTCGGDIYVWEAFPCGGDIYVWEAFTCGGDIYVWEAFTCETSHQSEILHSLIFPYLAGSLRTLDRLKKKEKAAK